MLSLCDNEEIHGRMTMKSFFLKRVGSYESNKDLREMKFQEEEALLGEMRVYRYFWFS